MLSRMYTEFLNLYAFSAKPAISRIFKQPAAYNDCLFISRCVVNTVQEGGLRVTLFTRETFCSSVLLRHTHYKAY